MKEEICAPIILHRPTTVDAASSLALLQEELTTTTPRRETKRADMTLTFKPQVKSAVSASSSVPSSTQKAPQFSSPDEKKHIDSLKLSSTAEILNAIKSYRRAKGLCYKCGIKWGPTHKFAPQVALHVVEELWQLLQVPGAMSKSLGDSDSDSGEELMALSLYAVHGIDAPRTIRVMGNLNGQTPLILLDSGSSSTFISEQLAAKFTNWTPLANPTLVKIADGATIWCTHEL